MLEFVFIAVICCFPQELLALGERIGYVNTGLSEDKIRTGLKQWKYESIPIEEPLTGVEPCCICQVIRRPYIF